MLAIYKVLSALLSYPETELQHAAPDLIRIIADDTLIPGPDRAALIHLVVRIAETELLDAQSDYVDLFDRTRALSLHFFEHVHGESRDRGQAMVSLRERYRQAAFDIVSNELPDYIPLFLEFLSLQNQTEARNMLSETAPILAALSERLKKRDSLYAAVFDCLSALCQAPPDAEMLSQLRETNVDNPQDLDAVDRAWEEAEVRFGPGTDAGSECPRATEMLRKFDPKQHRIRSAP